MDAESFLEFASQVTKWKMYPYFDVAHSVLCALHVRDDLGPGNVITISVNPKVSITVRVSCARPSYVVRSVTFSQERWHSLVSTPSPVGCPPCWSFLPAVCLVPRCLANHHWRRSKTLNNSLSLRLSGEHYPEPALAPLNRIAYSSYNLLFYAGTWCFTHRSISGTALPSFFL